MVLALFHTREFRDYDHLERVLTRLRLRLPAITQIITTGAPGADPMGARYARALGLPVQVLRPNYRRFGRDARHLLNHQALAKADALVAFHDGTSQGTLHALQEARRRRLPYVIKVLVTVSRAGDQSTPRP